MAATSEQDRAQVGRLAEAAQAATGEAVTLAYVDQGYTGEASVDVALEHGIALEVVRLPETRKGFVLLPRRWVVERSVAWLSKFRRLARDYERADETLAGIHWGAFVCLRLARAVPRLAGSP